MTMKAIVIALTLSCALPLQAQTPPEAKDSPGLIEQGFDYLFRGLLAEVEPQLDELGRGFKEMQPQIQQLFTLIDDLKNYEAPQRLENGDILIPRRKDVPQPLLKINPPEIEL